MSRGTSPIAIIYRYFALFWLWYYSSGNETYCDSLIVNPGSTSQFLKVYGKNLAQLFKQFNLENAIQILEEVDPDNLT